MTGSPRTLGASLALLGALVGCSDESIHPVATGDAPYVQPAAACEAPSLDDLATFPLCNTGRGIFGTWIVDNLGLPAYEYGLDQNADERAAFFNTEGVDRRDHWAAFGNSRVNALASNQGYIEVTTQDRGETYLDKFDEAAHGFAGGFSYIDDGHATWSTAYGWRPKGARTDRRFGMGYAEASMDYRDVHVLRRTFAPAGDAPVVMDEVTLVNVGADTKTLRHYEVWDVGRRPIEINWVVSGIPLDSVPEQARAARDARNGLFQETVAWDATSRVLGLRRTHANGVVAPPPEAPSPTDYYPGEPFLGVLEGDVTDIYSDQEAFFGDGGLSAPSAVVSRLPGDGTSQVIIGPPRSGLGQPRMFGIRSDVSIPSGEKKTLRFVYGYAPWGEPWPIDPGWLEPDQHLVTLQAKAIQDHLFYFAADRDPVLHREMAWHAYQMEASVGWRDYWNTHVVPQGSAYLYLHGADGAARDLSLFSIPLAYTHPALAREELGMNMRITHAADRRISYAFQGHGMLDDALGLHTGPSDLGIFLLWAVSEYVGATGDLAFLDEPMPYDPVGAVRDATTWDHVHDAVRYLFDVVGTGEHGLVKIGTGDWSDGIVLEAADRDLAVAKGESVPNTQMAVYVLPRVADLCDERDPALASEIRGRVEALRAAAAKTWTGSFFGRAYFGDGKLAYADRPNLEAQVWALIGDTFAEPGDRARLVSTVQTMLDDPSPAGATLVPDGQVWPAISGLLTWGYARSDPELAWNHLVKNTMAGHAEAYPEIWYGIWSGPDGLNGPSGDRPGEAWYSQVTPMVDFPTMNNNQHAMPMLAALRVAGIEATARGLSIDPRVPGGHFSLHTELIDLAVDAGVIRGAYRPIAARSLEVVAPAGAVVQKATLDGVDIPIMPGAISVVFAVPAALSSLSGSAFEVTTAP